MAWNPGLTRLRNLLADLYPTIQLSREILEQAGLPTAHIEFSAAANSNWHEILKEASLRKRVPDIVAVARADYPERNAELTAAEQEHSAYGEQPSPPTQGVGEQEAGAELSPAEVVSREPPKPAFDEFALEIERDGRIKARLTRADGSSAPLAKGRLSEDRLVLNSIHKDRAKLRDEENPIKPDDLRIFGQALYAAVLPGEVGALLERAVQGVQEKTLLTKQDWRLRVVVEADLQSEVFDWPLELLYYDDGKHRGWLATEDLPIIFSRRTQITGREVTPLERGPLRVLVVFSNPSSLGGGTAQEILKEMGELVVAGGDTARAEKRFEVRMLAEEQGAGLADAIEYAGKPEWRRIDELGEDEERWRPHVLHFIGHGRYEQIQRQGRLALVKGDEVDWCSADDLIRAVRSWNLRMVVLQPCEKAVSGTEPALVSLVNDLIRADIPAVVATQLSMTGRSAAEFAKGFYQALLNGSEVDRAVQRGRRDIYRDSRGRSPDFAAPVLFAYDSSQIVRPRAR